jgi:uncharacterized protein (TIGR03086 family)
MSDDAVEVLARGLEQTALIMAEVTDERLADPTPCPDWTLSDLVDHVVLGTANFARSVRGEHVDWSAPTPHVGPERVDAFRTAAADLLTAWRERGEGAEPGPDWQSAETAVHAYDLAAALGRSTADLDPEVAERGLAFMRAHLRPEIRGEAFGPEQAAPEGADPYQRIAAFAGRSL